MLRGSVLLMLMFVVSVPDQARALGLGDLRVTSALNEPLSARINIVGATADELTAATATVASAEVFQLHHLDRPAYLASVRFKIVRDGVGGAVLEIRSSDVFTDPVVNVFVDLRWAGKKLLRDYILLLDPVLRSSSNTPPVSATPLAGAIDSALVPSVPAIAMHSTRPKPGQPRGTVLDAQAMTSSAMKTTVQSLQRALDDTNQQITNVTAKIQELKRLSARSVAAQVAAPVATPVAAPVAAAPAPMVRMAVATAGNSTRAPRAVPAPAVVKSIQTRKTTIQAYGYERTFLLGLSLALLALAALYGGFTYAHSRSKTWLNQRLGLATHGNSMGAGFADLPRQPAAAAVAAEPAADERASQYTAGEALTSEESVPVDPIEWSTLNSIVVSPASGPEALEFSKFRNGGDTAEYPVPASDQEAAGPTPTNAVLLDYNLTDLDATAQYIEIPSQLTDRGFVAERRTSIADALVAALRRDPSRHDLRMKLLETYFSAALANQRAFKEVALRVSGERALLSADDWQQVVKMGQQIVVDSSWLTTLSDDTKLAACA